MQINNDVKLDFCDVLIQPKRSTLVSRSEVELKRTYKFRNTPGFTWTGVGIIASNMSTVGTPQMACALKEHNMLTCLHKHSDYLDKEKMVEGGADGVILSVGMKVVPDHYDLEGHIVFLESHGVPVNFICLDVANGYSERFVQTVTDIKNMFPDKVIMAGNVVTPNMVEALILAGADVVKVGIGCLTADTRILMSNGLYKNIVDVKPGDRIINHQGKPVTVKNVWSTGYKPVRQIRHTNFYKPLTLTDNHLVWSGDLRNISCATVSSRGYSTLVDQNDRFGNSKIKWIPSKDLIPTQTTGLLPKVVEFELPKTFFINISDYAERKWNLKHYNTKLVEPSYELGYMFGTFLGDGNAKLDKNNSGQVHWTFHTSEISIVNKLHDCLEKIVGKSGKSILRDNTLRVVMYSKQWALLFTEFGKRTGKHLPEKYLCGDVGYLQGIFDGLMDSDGSVDNGRLCFTNTSEQLIELYGFLCKVLKGSFPNYSQGSLQSSDLVKALNKSYTSRLNISHVKRHTNNYQVVKLLGVEEQEVLQEVWDIEVDDESHSFIANNMIVHNSGAACTTRLKTGVGYPQLSAIIECADAAHGLNGHIIGDGGCQTPGDVCKAFAAGADFVMLGNMFAGHNESGGTLICTHDGVTKEVEDEELKNGVVAIAGERFRIDDYPERFKVEFYGMSSRKANDKFAGGMQDYRASEGRELLVPYKGSVDNTVQEILGGLRSCCTYVGAKTLKELPKRTTFIKVNNQYNRSLERFEVK